MEQQTLSFSVQGEFITQLAHEKLYRNNDLNAALELLTACLKSDQLSEEQTLGMAMRILNGQAEIRGTYPSDDYGYFVTDTKATKLTAKLSELKSYKEENDSLKYEIEKLREKLNFIETNISVREGEALQEEAKNEWGITLFESAVFTFSSRSSAVSHIIDSVIQATEFNDNYGWLDPQGKFTPVKWCEHNEWAHDYLINNLGCNEADIEYHMSTDILVEKGWVLLHNPSQGMPHATRSLKRNLTKSQKEFLYNFFMERRMKDEANEIMQDTED